MREFSAGSDAHLDANDFAAAFEELYESVPGYVARMSWITLAVDEACATHSLTSRPMFPTNTTVDVAAPSAML